MDALNARAIVGTGTSEAEWQASGVLERMADTSFAQLLDGATRVVVVSPHPDDEVLGCGGLLAHAAASGVPVLVVAVTDGEHCYPQHPLWTPERLRAARAEELHRALATLGVDADCVLRLSMDDGGVTGLEDALALILADALRPTDLLLAPWCRDGHPDHEATLVAARIAAADTGCRLLQYPVWAWHWMRPEHDDWRSPALLRLPLDGDALRRKTAALACFDTQTGSGHPEIDSPVLPPHVVQRFTRSCEVFFR